MLYRILKRLIEKNQTEGLGTKIDIFFAAGKLTDEQYNELSDLIKDLSYTRDSSCE